MSSFNELLCPKCGEALNKKALKTRLYCPRCKTNLKNDIYIDFLEYIVEQGIVDNFDFFDTSLFGNDFLKYESNEMDGEHDIAAVENAHRSLDEVIREFADMGYITSFCTAGYRCGRTGKCIMDLLRTGKEGQFCKLNAVLTFREWLNDFAGEETKKAGEKVIEKEIEEVKVAMPGIFSNFMDYYERIKKGERDLYF